MIKDTYECRQWQAYYKSLVSASATSSFTQKSLLKSMTTSVFKSSAVTNSLDNYSVGTTLNQTGNLVFTNQSFSGNSAASFQFSNTEYIFGAALVRLDRDITQRLYFIKNYYYYAITICFGVLAFTIAKLFAKLRQKLYMEEGNIDRAFDAGRKVNYGLIASLLISNWTWAATLLQSATVAAKFGLSGAFWYAAGASIQLILFSILAIQLKIIAPGSNTFLQLLRVRFGAKCHIVYCIIAIMTNFIVTSLLLLGGYGVCKYIIEDISILNFSVLMIAVIGSYTMIAGFVGTLYVSFFNTSLIFIILIYLCHQLYSQNTAIGGLNNIYNYVSCLIGPDGNMNNNYLTLVSLSGLQFGIINLIGNFGAVFIDQSYWNCAIASKPKNSAIGFILGGLIWFSIPFTMATAGGLAYRALEFAAGKPLLSFDDIDRGLVLPRTLALILGIKGTYLIYLTLLMAISSTASSSIVAVTSIVTFDIYQTYIKPFRRTTDYNSCILCGMQRGRKSNIRDQCKCVSKTYCSGCNLDDRDHQMNNYVVAIYKCKTHGNFRNYYHELENRRAWIMLTIIFSIFPLTFLLNLMNINLNWLYQFMGILIGSAIVPLWLSLYWQKLTSIAMIAGAIGGASVGLLSWAIISALTRAKDLRKNADSNIVVASFIDYSGRGIPMLVGNASAIIVGGLVTTILSIIESRRNNFQSSSEIWETTRDIDNPLSPWVEVYENEFDLKDTHYLGDRPSVEEVKAKYHKLNQWTISISITLCLIIIIVWPSVACIFKVFSYKNLRQWVNFSLFLMWIGAIFITVAPIILEIMAVVRQLKKSKKALVFPEPTPQPDLTKQNDENAS